MIIDFLLEHQWLTPSALLLIVVVGPFAGKVLARRPRVALVATVASLVPLAALTLIPQRRRLFGRCELGWESWAWPTPGRVELMANLVLFVAPVLLLAVLLRRPLLAFLAGTATSALIETTQAIVTGLGRSCTSSDWVTNTMGAALGALLGAIALRLARPSEDGP